MYRQLTLAVTLASAALVAADARAQAYSYRHRSTIAGDYLSGAADAISAQGNYLVNEAKAAQIWTKTEQAADDISIRRTEYRYQALAMERDYMQQQFQDRKARQQSLVDGRLRSAQRLWTEAQHGLPTWPVALGRSEFTSSMKLIESLLRNWSPETSPLGDPYRRALITEVGIVRARIIDHPQVAFNDRVDAMRTLNSLDMLAAYSSSEPTLSPATLVPVSSVAALPPAPAAPSDNVGGGRLAMR